LLIFGLFVGRVIWSFLGPLLIQLFGVLLVLTQTYFWPLIGPIYLAFVVFFEHPGLFNAHCWPHLIPVLALSYFSPIVCPTFLAYCQIQIISTPGRVCYKSKSHIFQSKSLTLITQRFKKGEKGFCCTQNYCHDFPPTHFLSLIS
jgi:hypothetical protein